jgi:hypothetical protein
MGEVWLPLEYRPPRVVVVRIWPGMSDNRTTPFLVGKPRTTWSLDVILAST